ncbi:MAG: helix-turn-helix domain-containing protein [Azoarcus sp.]|jgi:putative transcriptional regulator|nr:helix-turn-helix domain-containing protein [Azoarcus sp.]
MTRLADLEKMDVEALASAIEADAGEAVPGIREALAQAKAGDFARVTTPGQMLLREARRKAGMTQLAFAEAIATPVATLRDWEQGRFDPPGNVLCLMKLIARHPYLIQELAMA